jgi:uncharacterized membrane protein YbhN (UPF0104 family)
MAVIQAKESPMVDDLEARSLSTRQLLGRIVEVGSLLVTKEVELARAEIKAEIGAELDMVKLLIAAAVAALFGINMLLIAAVFALALWLPPWLAAVGFAGLMLAAAVVVGLIGWSRRVRSPLAVTRKTVKEDLQWARERLA